MSTRHEGVRHRRTAAFAAGLACGLLCLLGCGHSESSTKAIEAQKPPVILISLDTLRADHLSCYGYARETTPQLDKFAREEAVLFENAITPETWTLPAHMSMLTGLFPQHHGVTPEKALAAEIETLPELLQKHGYATAGFTGHSWWMRTDRGFGQGMSHYDNAGCDKPGDPCVMLRPIPETQQRLSAWLDRPMDRPPFIFFHAYDLHYKISEMGYELPYGPEPGFPLQFAAPYLAQGAFQGGAKADLKASALLHAARKGDISLSDVEKDAIVALYDDALHMVDASLGALFEKLREKGLYDDALIIITSDHGEGMGERGYYDHEDVWEEEARVPLLIKLPGSAHAGARVSAQVQLVDLFPTVAAVAGIEGAPETDGINLLTVIEGSSPGRASAYIRNGAARLALRTPEWKLHWRPHGQNDYLLFNLKEDPGEQKNRILDAPLPAKALRQAAHSFFGMAQSGWHIEVLAERDTPWRAQLRAKVDTPPTEAWLYGLWGNLTILEAAPSGALVVELGKDVPQHLVIPVTEPGTLELSIQSEGVFHFAAGALREESTEVKELLDAETIRYARPELQADKKAPQISVWYIPPQQGVSAESGLSPELEEQLKDLGYF